MVEFSPDTSLVAFTKRLSSTVTIIDIKSGNTWLVIDTGARTCGLRITEDKIIVVSDEQFITWDLPARDSVFNTRRDINDSVQITTFRSSAPVELLHASISPDLNYIAFGDGRSVQEALCIYHTHTGKKLAVTTSGGNIPGFAPSGHEVWCTTSAGQVDQWAIVEEDGPNVIKLEQFGKDIKPISGFPWHSSQDYEVADSGWILCPGGKWLLWLPHHWQPDARIQRKWSGKFLAVWNQDSQEPCILELDV